MKRFNLRTAVIGVGNMGKNHARILSEISKLVAVCDVIPKTARVVAAEYDIPYYTALDQLFEKEKLDAVVVAVPTPYHYETAKIVLQHKIPLLLEKPIALKEREGKNLKILAKENKTFFMVGHVERYNPVIKQLKKMIDQGVFGKIISLLAVRVGVVPPKIKNSNVALDLGIHDLDVFNYLLSELPLHVTKINHQLFKENIADTSSILVEYPHTSGMIQVNWVTPIKIRKLYITGTKQFAEVDYINQQIVTLNRVIPIQSQNFFELVQLYEGTFKQVYKTSKEPLVEEHKFFLSNLNKKSSQESLDSAINSVKFLS